MNGGRKSGITINNRSQPSMYTRLSWKGRPDARISPVVSCDFCDRCRVRMATDHGNGRWGSDENSCRRACRPMASLGTDRHHQNRRDQTKVAHYPKSASHDQQPVRVAPRADRSPTGVTPRLRCQQCGIGWLVYCTRLTSGCTGGTSRTLTVHRTCMADIVRLTSGQDLTRVCWKCIGWRVVATGENLALKFLNSQ